MKEMNSTDESHEELKSAVRELCRDYPDKYWRELDEKRAYPEAFVQALTHAGYMATLIPEEYGGAGLGVTEAPSSSKKFTTRAEMPRHATRRCTSWARFCGTDRKRTSGSTCRKSPMALFGFRPSG